MTVPITEKYRPETFDEIQGNNKSLSKIEQWARDWSVGDEPQLLVGEPGTGKTTTAMVVADTMDYPLNEFNVSDARKTDDIDDISRAMVSSPATADHQVVLLDETDSWHHASSKKKLYEQLREPKNPIILTANDEYDVPAPIKGESNVHKFKLGKRSRKAKIKEIAEKEGIDLSDSQLKGLVERPDLRTALNDLQDYTEHGSFQDTRVWSESEFDAMQNLLGGNSREWKESLSVRSETFSNPETAMMWVDENVSQEWRGFELGIVYKLLTSADISLGRAQDQQAYRYWKYASAMLSIVDETRLSKPYDGYIRADFPSWFKAKSEKHDDGSSESELFHKLKGKTGFSMSCSYFEFQNRILPILKDMSMEEKLEFAIDNGLNEDEAQALGLEGDQLSDHREIEEPEQGDGWKPDTAQASVANW